MSTGIIRIASRVEGRYLRACGGGRRAIIGGVVRPDGHCRHGSHASITSLAYTRPSPHAVFERCQDPRRCFSGEGADGIDRSKFTHEVEVEMPDVGEGVTGETDLLMRCHHNNIDGDTHEFTISCPFLGLVQV